MDQDNDPARPWLERGRALDRVTRANKQVPDMGSRPSWFASKLADGRDGEEKNKHAEEGAKGERTQTRKKGRGAHVQRGRGEGGCRKIGKMIGRGEPPALVLTNGDERRSRALSAPTGISRV
jgi:hypothetical protein